MDPIHVGDNGNCFDNTQDENLLSQDSDGEAVILPRIGDEFQVQLPPHSAHTSYTTESIDQDFLIGLPIPLVWIRLKDEKLSHCCCPETKYSKDVILKENTSCENGSLLVSKFSFEAKNHSSAGKICGCNLSNSLLVPESPIIHWSSHEKKVFLLALYIFEKDFVEIKRFLGTKGTGALLAYYYGTFYSSKEYRRWSDCRKVKGKKGIYGRRLFSGLRQQELLSRILLSVSEDCQNALVEVSKAFADETMSFPDYVSSLKTMVGMNLLVEAVGIGTGKRDLTTMTIEPSRSNQTTSIRPEMPTGKACSSLTASEIIKFLSGDYRLSKAKSSDLFWEAVWPRLLARGWHSEQPKDHAGSKSCLVFLVPEVKKFSRRKLVKGDHYFDSVTDVLGRVALEPGLISLENEEDSCVKVERDDVDKPPARQKPCFLQPRTPKRSTAVMKFTVVDTSLSDGKIRELRALPFEISVAQFFDEGSAESGTVNSNINKNQNSQPVKKITKPGLKITKSQKAKLKHSNDNYMDPMSKRCRVLSASVQEETHVGLPRILQSCCSGTNEGTENSSSQLGDKLSSVGSCRSSPRESIENCQTHMLIDLNLPHTSTDSENLVFTKEQAEESSVQTQQTGANPGRHSTRNRPLTSRAMEALVNGYLTVNRRRKAETNAGLRPVQRARFSRGGYLNESMNSSVCSQGENDACNVNVFAQSSEVPKQENAESVSGHFHGQSM